MTTASAVRLGRAEREPRYFASVDAVPAVNTSLQRKMLVLLVVVNLLLVIALGFLAYHVANNLFAVEATSRLVMQSQQEIWRLNMELDVAMSSKMMSAIGQQTATSKTELVGQR